MSGIIPLLNIPVIDLPGQNGSLNPGVLALLVLTVLMLALLLYFNRRLRVESNLRPADAVLEAALPPQG